MASTMEDSFSFSSDDCEKAMEEYSSYEEKVISGLIVQMFYFAYTINTIKEIDQELVDIAQSFGGHATREQGILNNRRDIDFEFSSSHDAELFRLKINSSARFYLHQGLNVMGKIHEKPTMEQLMDRKELLKQINCGPDSCLLQV